MKSNQIKAEAAPAPAASNPATDALKLKAINAELLAALEKIALPVMMADRKPFQRNNYCYNWIVEPLEPCNCAICKVRAAIARGKKGDRR